MTIKSLVFILDLDFNPEATLKTCFCVSHSPNSIVSALSHNVFLLSHIPPPEATIRNVPKKVDTDITPVCVSVLLQQLSLKIIQSTDSNFLNNIISLPRGTGQAEVKHCRHDSKKHDRFSQYWHHQFMWPWCIGFDSKSGLSCKCIFSQPCLRQISGRVQLFREEIFWRNAPGGNLLFFHFHPLVGFLLLCATYFSYLSICSFAPPFFCFQRLPISPRTQAFLLQNGFFLLIFLLPPLSSPTLLPLFLNHTSGM